MVLRPTEAKGSGGFSDNFSQRKQFHLGAVYALIHLVNKHLLSIFSVLVPSPCDAEI